MADQAASSGVSKFGFNLQNVLYEANPGSNLVHSPFSLHVVLAMLKCGARNQTAIDLQHVCNFPEDDAVLAPGYKQLLSDISSGQSEENGLTVATANRIYAHRGFQIKSEFEAVIRDSFASGHDEEIQRLDFARRHEAANEINAWVQGATLDKIKNLISPDDLDSWTRLVLVNGVYFRGMWKVPFGPREWRTKKKPFQALTESGAIVEVEVDMMQMGYKVWFPYTETTHAGVLEIPYKAEQFSMLIFLPNEVDGLASVLKEVVDHEELFKSMTTTHQIEINLPRFRVECAHKLVEPLKQLGLHRLFDKEEADFTGITDEPFFHVSHAVQKVFIAVDETGTEAAAATGGIMRLLSKSLNVRVFNVDHSFMFQIIHKPSLAVLFAGCVTNPVLE